LKRVCVEIVWKGYSAPTVSSEKYHKIALASQGLSASPRLLTNLYEENARATKINILSS
jgi:hypothetical protein